MQRAVAKLAALVVLPLAVARGAPTARFELPGFPQAFLAGGGTIELSPVGLLRELHRAGVHGLGDLETADADYGIISRESIPVFAAWLESACRAVGFELSAARDREYDGSAVARLLRVATGLGDLRTAGAPLAVPIGALVCDRRARWGQLPGDGARDAYILLATEAGMIVYDPPTRQVTTLAEFPNREHIVRIRF